MLLSDVIRRVNKDDEVVVTDGMQLTLRCKCDAIPQELYLRGVDFIAASNIGGLHLRIVLDDPALYHDTF